MTRQEAVDKLCDVYAGSFDVTRHEEARQPLMATMDFFVHNSKYVLSKKAKLWEANSFEYVYLFSVPHLTKELYNMMPFAASMVIIAFTSKRSRAPKAEGIPYDKGQR